jgi:hypothetical protein
MAPLNAYDPAIARHGAANVDAAVQAYLKAGVPSDKLVLGTRFVSTGWQGVADAGNGLYQQNDGPAPGTWGAAGAAPSGSFGYQDLEQNYLGSYTRFWHDEAQVPWLYSPNTEVFIAYEDPQSLQLKAGYVVESGLGGVMIWQLAADDERHSLVNALAVFYSSREETRCGVCGSILCELRHVPIRVPERPSPSKTPIRTRPLQWFLQPRVASQRCLLSACQTSPRLASARVVSTGLSIAAFRKRCQANTKP